MHSPNWLACQDRCGVRRGVACPQLETLRAEERALIHLAGPLGWRAAAGSQRMHWRYLACLSLRQEAGRLHRVLCTRVTKTAQRCPVSTSHSMLLGGRKQDPAPGTKGRPKHSPQGLPISVRPRRAAYWAGRRLLFGSHRSELSCIFRCLCAWCMHSAIAEQQPLCGFCFLCYIAAAGAEQAAKRMTVQASS